MTSEVERAECGLEVGRGGGGSRPPSDAWAERLLARVEGLSESAALRLCAAQSARTNESASFMLHKLSIELTKAGDKSEDL